MTPYPAPWRWRSLVDQPTQSIAVISLKMQLRIERGRNRTPSGRDGRTILFKKKNELKALWLGLTAADCASTDR
jgi:hypothetical protein